MKHLFVILLSIATVNAFAQKSEDVNLHLDKIKMKKGESQITAIVGGVLVASGGAVAGFGGYKIHQGDKAFGGMLVGAGGLFFGTGLTMTIVGGRKWRLHVKGAKLD